VSRTTCRAVLKVYEVRIVAAGDDTFEGGIYPPGIVQRAGSMKCVRFQACKRSDRTIPKVAGPTSEGPSNLQSVHAPAKKKRREARLHAYWPGIRALRSDFLGTAAWPQKNFVFAAV